MTLCPSVCVCLSVISHCPVEMDGRIELFLHEGSSVCIYTVSTKIRELSSRNLCQTADLKNFFGKSIVETCYRLSSRKLDAQSVINWTVVSQLS